MKNWLASSLLLFFGVLQGIEYRPWYPDALQLQGELNYRFQSYHSVDAPSSKRGESYSHYQKKKNHYSSDDHFVDSSLMIAFEPFSLQIESEFADTRKRNFDWDHVSLAGRYLWLNDNVGDPVSLSTGVSLRRAWREAVNDISSFHHGRNEAFFHVALGKQKIEGDTWLSRWWGVLGIGTADRWTPWIAANAAYEWNECDSHRLRLYVNSLWGVGNKKLRVHDFGGYGPIAHRSIDIGLRYSYEFDYLGLISIDYARRVYAHNFPDDVNTLTVSYIYPFGPEGIYYILKAYSLMTGKMNPW